MSPQVLNRISQSKLSALHPQQAHRITKEQYSLLSKSQQKLIDRLKEKEKFFPEYKLRGDTFRMDYLKEKKAIQKVIRQFHAME